VVVKGNAPGDFRNWTSTGTMLAAGVSQSTLKGSILPAGTGSDVWAVYVYNGDVAARKYASGAWGAETVIYDNTDITITDIAPPSAAVDSAGRVHVVFGDSHTDSGTLRPHIRYAFNSTATSWSSTTVISSSAATHGYRYPTVSLETSANGVYAFFVNSSASTQNEVIALKKASVGLSWSPLTLPNHSTNVKTYLTSIYSVAGEDMICIQWTETIPLSDYDVYFDKIPEFSEVVVPVVLMLVIFFVVARRREKGKSV
jgi:hypothetical protein